MKQKVTSVAIRRLVSGAATASVAMTLTSVPLMVFAQDTATTAQARKDQQVSIDAAGETAQPIA